MMSRVIRGNYCIRKIPIRKIRRKTLFEEQIRAIHRALLHAAQQSIRDAMEPYVSSKTLNIISDCFIEWMNKEQHSMNQKTAEQIGYIAYNFPIDRLIDKIIKEGINGKKIIHILQNKSNNLIESVTGWIPDEVEHFKLVLFSFRTLEKSKFIQNMNSALQKHHIDSDIIAKIRKMLTDDIFGIEVVHYNIRKDNDIELFSENIINIVHEFVEQNKYDKDLMKRIYTAIAGCFVPDDTVDVDPNTIRDWICSNCGNYNFVQQVGGEMNYDLKCCT
eukprot:348430_1